MNCRDVETLLWAERDGALTTAQRALLERHGAECPACRQMRSALVQGLQGLRADAAAVAVPNAEEEWQALRTRLHTVEAKPTEKRRLAPVIWLGTPLAAVAAIAIVFFVEVPVQPPTAFAPQSSEVARADFVETTDTNTSTMVYVDKESGWLVVWAADNGALPGE